MDHAGRKHATYGASSAYRWFACPGSVALAARAPNRVTRYTLDGTEAHELLDYALKHRIWDARQASIAAGTLARDTRPEAGERLDAVQVALDYVYDLLLSYDDAILYVEHPFKFPSIYTDDAYGTCDCLVYVPSLSLLFVIDYKHGIGKPVEATNNKQGFYYAAGAIEGSGGLDADLICVVIIQPRCFHPKGRIREHTVSRLFLKDFCNEVDDAILAAMEITAPLCPGDHCDWCPANITCPAREAEALKAVGMNFRTVREVAHVPAKAEVATLPVDRLMYIRNAGHVLRKFLDDVDAALYQHAMAGHHVPDNKLVEAQARRHWEGDEVRIASALMRLCDTDDWDNVYPRKLITITEATRLVKEAIKKGGVKAKDAAEAANIALAALTLKESSGNLVLVPNTDPRQPVNRAAVAFQGVVALPQPPIAQALATESEP